MMIKINKRDVKLFFFFFVFFLISIFFTNIIFTDDIKTDYEEHIKHKDIIEKTSPLTPLLEERGIISEQNELINITENDLYIYNQILNEYKNRLIQKELELNSASNINFIFEPKNIENTAEINNHISNISNLLSGEIFEEKNMFFDVVFNKNKTGTRGKMKDRKIWLYGIIDIFPEELLSIFIHELGHYIDIYFLEKKIFFNPSDKFYNISWEDTKVIKPGLEIRDFVSGYAMTNKYEDFAEAFTYYVLHNDHFFKKASESDILMQKYIFMSEYVFKNGEFQNTNFSSSSQILDYYWDITKIEYFLEKLLEYIKYGL